MDARPSSALSSVIGGMPAFSACLSFDLDLQHDLMSKNLHLPVFVSLVDCDSLPGAREDLA
jgi:hypothetical protein